MQEVLHTIPAFEHLLGNLITTQSLDKPPGGGVPFPETSHYPGRGELPLGLLESLPVPETLFDEVFEVVRFL